MTVSLARSIPTSNPFRFWKISGLSILLVLVMQTTASAESGRLHFSADLGLGGAAAGRTAYRGNDRAHSLGAIVGLGLDWQFRPPFALEGQLLLGGFNSSIPGSGLDGTFVAGGSFGARVRLLEDQHGYATQHGGNLRGHLWVSGNFTFMSFDAFQYGFGASAGYAMSVHRPLLIGPFLRTTVLFAGKNPGSDLIMVGGLQFTMEIIRLPGEADQDGDGLDDDEETRYRTNPRSNDTDADGILDPVEIRTRTDPTSRDTDGDGLSDGMEDENGNGRMDLEETDPRVADTDGGGVPDGVEVREHHSDPRDPRDDGQAYLNGRPAPEEPVADVPPPTEPVEVATVDFLPGRTRLTPAGTRALERLASRIRANGTGTTLVLYVKSSGDASADAALAQRRADAIATWLAQHRVPRTRYTLTAGGADPEPSRTVSPNTATISITHPTAATPAP